MRSLGISALQGGEVQLSMAASGSASGPSRAQHLPNHPVGALLDDREWAGDLANRQAGSLFQA